MAQPKIEKSNVVNFDCNGVVPPSQVEEATFYVVSRSWVGEKKMVIRVFKSNTYLTFFVHNEGDTKPEGPILTLPV